MKTTFELPDDLMRDLKIRAAQTNRKLKDVVSESIRRGLAAPPDPAGDDPVRAWCARLVFHDDGSVTNPEGIEDDAFFEALERIRADNRAAAPQDPFGDRA